MTASRRGQSSRVCTEPGCPNLQPCTAHQNAARKRADAARPNSAARGYDRRWREKAKRYLAAHPMCAWPGCTARAHAVDHIDGLGPRGPLGFDDSNLQGLCASHHSKKTALHDGGFGNKPKPN